LKCYESSAIKQILISDWQEAFPSPWSSEPTCPEPSCHISSPTCRPPAGPEYVQFPEQWHNGIASRYSESNNNNISNLG
jgi:hypothetical protein